MNKKQLLEKVYNKCQNNISNFNDIEYIEDYKEVVYKLLKKAMYKNFKAMEFDKQKLMKIKEYCDMVINFENLPNVIKECFKLIKEDYKYLAITKNIEYFFEREYDDKTILVYIEDIKDDIKRSLYDNQLTEKELLLIIKIANNSEKVLDINLERLFKSLVI